MNRFPYDQDDKSYAPIEAGRHLTGKNARLQVASLYAQFRKDPQKNQHIALPVEARQQRRAAKAEDRRQGRKGRRAFVRQERAKEQAASDLANLFRLDALDDPRAREAINARVDYLLAEAIKKDEDTDLTIVDIEQQLREIAAGARPDMGRRSRIAANLLTREAVGQ